MKKINILTLVTLLFASLGFAQELVTNGDFETGDATGWSGNAANVVTENGNSYNAANVETAGNPYDVNLSSGLSLTPGATYTLTFDAWSDTDRTLIAGIGLYEAPWSNTSETVTLSTTSQTFTLTLTATGDVNSNSRVLFDMGAATGFVGIDNVSLIEDNDTTPTEGPETAAPTPTVDAGWVVSIFSDEYTDIAVNEWGPFWGDSSARINEVNIAENPTKVMDVQAGQVFAGIDFSGAAIDATTFDFFHVDYWVADPLSVGQVLNIKLSNHVGGAGETSAIIKSIVPTAGEWVSLDIPLDEFTSADGSGNLDRSAIAQIVLDAARADVNQPVAFYLDNIYFYSDNFSVSDLQNEQTVKLYPNPVKAGQDIMFSGDVTSVEVYSTTGKQVKVLKGASFNTSGLAKGVYFVRIKTAEGQIQTQKLLVK